MLKVIAINGSARKGKNTALMLRAVLSELETWGVSTEMLELTEYDLNYCKSCNHCLTHSSCRIEDGMAYIGEKLQEAQGVVLGSPNYFNNVSGQLKVFMDRTRFLHMTDPLLEGKVGGAVVVSGLRNGGQELTMQIMEKFFINHGMLIANGREGQIGIRGEMYTGGPMGSLFKGINKSTGKVIWSRSVLEDTIAIEACKILGVNMYKLMNKTTI